MFDHFVRSLLNCIFFHFILGNRVEGGVHLSTLPDDLLDRQPTIQEITSYARTAEYNQLGVILRLYSVNLAECRDCTSVYQLWINEKGRGATRRSLLNALRAIRQNNVADAYEDHLKTIVSYTMFPSLSICIYNKINKVDPLAKK